MVTQLSELVQKKSSYEQLGDTDKVIAKNWVRAELDHELFAEYQAWLATILIYQDGVSSGLWNRIDWVEELLKKKKINEPLKNFTYRFLNEHARNVN